MLHCIAGWLDFLSGPVLIFLFAAPFRLAETAAIKPETAAIKPETAAIKPETAAIKPETAAIKPETAAIKPETAAIKPETAAIKPETAAIKPETAAIKPETAAIKPETAAIKPETAAIKPETAAIKPETAAIKPETAAIKPETAAIKPETAAIKPETAAINPETAAIKPETAAIKPETAAIKPETATIKPARTRPFCSSHKKTMSTSFGNMLVPATVGLSSNHPLSNLRSTILMAHILNLTYTINATSSLITSIASILVPIDGASANGTESSVSLAEPSANKPPDGNLTSRNGKSEKSEAENLEIFNKYFTSVIDPIVIVTGIVGNALLALVFTITPLKLRPLSHVLSVLSIADLIYISSYLLVYLTKRDVKIYAIPGLCQVLNFFLTFSKSVEAWYIFLSHLSRLKALTSASSEVQKRRVFNIRFANVMIAILVAAPLLHVLWSMETVRVAATTYCVPMRETILVHLTLRKLEIIAAVLLPLLLIAGVDLFLIVKLVIYVAFKDNNKDGSSNISSKHSYFTSSSCPDKTVLVAVQTDRCDEKITECHKNADKSFSDMNKELSLALQIAYRILQDTPATNDCGSQQNSFPSAKLTELDNTRETNGGFPQDISRPTGSSGSVHYCSEIPELQQQSIDDRSSFSSVESPKRSISEDPSSDSSETRLIEDATLEVPLSNTDLGKETPDLLSCSKALVAKNSKTSNRDKQYNITNFILKSVRKYKFRRSLHFNKRLHMVTYDYNQISTQVTNSDNQSFTFSSSHCTSQEYSSDVSIPSSPVSLDESVLPHDSTACTVTTILLGVILALTFLPSGYANAVNLFLGSPSTPPTAQQMQQAIMFESLIKLNAVYKLFLYMLIMPSFRSAIMWLLRHWIPSKFTRMSSICSPCTIKGGLVYV